MPDHGLLGPQEVRRLATQLGVKPTKQRGQNFVIDANTIRRIVSLAGLRSDDTVLEIGPGLGSLTLGLLERAASVTAVEIDERLAGQLPLSVEQRMGTGAAQRLRTVTADALRVTELPGPAPSVVVANLPYNVSVPVLLHLLEHFPSWSHGLVLVQLEVADRLAAQPGTKIYGAPSAKLAWFATATRSGNVPPAVFWPVPNVDSGLVLIQRHDPPPSSAAREQVFAVVDAAFAQRRKMLRAALAPLVGSSQQASQAIEAAGIDPSRRGETLSISDYAAIAERVFVCP
ncbi:MAG: 16S rRNA (adenine(1518)-N(6)/adenine(1519)-N(6))-dimethyltransferase RsmA [Arachnia sp.]